MKKTLLACSLLLLTSACVNNTSEVIRPESLISSSSEKISFPISDSASVITIENWINGGDLPTGADISCGDGNPSCLSVKTFLTNHKISFNETPSADSAGNISLSYNRIIARNCKTTSFGCATSVNSIHMVTNREQFIKPVLSDYQDAASAVKAVSKYVK